MRSKVSDGVPDGRGEDVDQPVRKPSRSRRSARPKARAAGKLTYPATPDGCGRKHDDAKVDYSLIKTAAEREFAAALSYGAELYGRDNWKDVPQAFDRYFAALRRHLAAFRAGEIFDPQSGLHHLAHAECCVHFILELALEQAELTSDASFGARFGAAIEAARALRALKKEAADARA